MRQALVLPLLLLGLAGCHDGSSGSLTTNLGLAARAIVGQSELQVLLVPEFSQGQADLNGDGDALDDVPHVLDLGTGSLRSLGLAAELGTTAVGDRLVAFAVSEAGQGDSDLNGDGDALDLVLHVHDAASGVTTSTALATPALSPPAIGAASMAFLVGEQAQGGQDLDGDGDTSGFVLHVYDARTGLTSNALRSATSQPLFHDHAFAFTTDEPSSAADLNGDGDTEDLMVLELYDFLLGGVEQTPLAIRDRPLAVGVDDWFVLVDEDAQELDLNGDGDQLDGVWHALDPHGHVQTPLGFSSLDTLGSTDDDALLALVAEEIDGLDQDGDGDLEDTFVFLHDPAHAQTFAPALPVDPEAAFALADGRLVFGVDEARAGLDLDGDLDLADDVLHTLDVTNGDVTNLALDFVLAVGVGANVLLWRDEEESGVDQNGDGDALDVVLAKLQPQAGLVTSVGLASLPPPLATGAGWALVAVSESGQGRDLNGDGDTLDQVAHRIEVVFPIEGDGGLVTRLGLAVEPSGAAILPGGSGLLLVSEAAQGRDLNGDGDRFDAVVHRFE